jgi:hypothetical protein
MAAPNPNRPELGDILIVIREHCEITLFYHRKLADTSDTADDFQARSSDELSLAKGDRVELLERDDEFGDGWFLGKHTVNGNSGLFPEGGFTHVL